MRFLTVDRILWVFTFIIRLLEKLSDKHEVNAQKIQQNIDKLSVAKNKVVSEHKRAQRVTENINKILN